MGQRLVSLATDDPDLAVVAGLEVATHPELGRDAGRLAGLGSIGVPLSSTLEVPADCVVDFSVPEALLSARFARLFLPPQGLMFRRRPQQCRNFETFTVFPYN